MQTSPAPYIPDSAGMVHSQLMCTARSLRWLGRLQRGISQPAEANLDINVMLRHKDWLSVEQGIRPVRNFLLPTVSFQSYIVKCHKIKVQSFITVNPAIYSMYMSLENV